ncbi:hypothetical protein JW905_15350 [bacterium]|nr:hypothetical protein [candidate division CSSED10-310 bacterium]
MDGEKRFDPSRIPEEYAFMQSEKNPYYERLRGFPGIVLHGADTERQAGRWVETIMGGDGPAPLHVEIGIGQGHFFADMAAAAPDCAFVGLEYGYKPLYRAARKLANRRIHNARLVLARAERLDRIFAPAEIDHAYVLFSDPWPRSKNANKRLLSAGFFSVLAECLKHRATVWVKTDHQDYFSWFRQQLDAHRPPFDILFSTTDLHSDTHDSSAAITHFEELFIKAGLPICFMELRRW